MEPFKKFNKFTLIKKIAHGGMAEIFLSCTGSIKQARRFVVLKKILQQQSNNKEFSKMFQNEGKIIANFNHSNVASIYEFGMANSQYFICMEYIQGRTLRQMAKKLSSKKTKFKIEHSAYIIKNVCLGLDYAHNYTDKLTGKPLHIIHRDISPQNIMISFNGEIKLIDFGIAKSTNSEATKTGVLKGKFEYMSPEQVSGKDLNNQTDIFSLGVVFWELLVGKKLFSANNELAVLRKIKDFRIPDLKKMRSLSIPNQLINIINRSLHPNKNMRYQTVAEMSHDISIFLNMEYPKFTPTEFNKFIKNTYINEIEEERNYLKLLTNELDEQEITKNTKLTQKTPTFTDKKSSAMFDESEINNPSFVGGVPSSTQSELDSTHQSPPTSTLTIQGETAPTVEFDNQRESKNLEAQNVTKNSSSQDSTSQITKTKFDDPLDDGPVNLKKKLTSKDTRDENTSTAYLPYLALDKLSVIKEKNHRLMLRKKAKRNKKIMFLASIFIIGGGIYFVKSQLPHKTKYAQLINKIYNNYFNNQKTKASKLKKSNNQKTATPSTSKHVAREVAGKKKLTKNIFLSSKPAGAFLYISGHKNTPTTPFMIKLPINKRIQVTVRKIGYHSKTIMLSKNSKEKLHILLQKMSDQEYPNEIIMQ